MGSWGKTSVLSLAHRNSVRSSPGSDAAAPRILVVDNYDSFTFNLVQLLRQLGAECQVVANDDPAWLTELTERPASAFSGAAGVVISAGPGRPRDAGFSLRAIAAAEGSVPLLGLCLGHQAIAEHYGARVVRALYPLHGKATPVLHDGRTLFAGVPERTLAARYNSLVVARNTLPDCLELSAESDSGEVMALRHRSLPIEGVQFHPESILSIDGPRIVSNWLESL